MNNLEHFLRKWEIAFWEFLPRLLFAIIVFLFFYFLAKFFKKLNLRFYTKAFKKQSNVVRIFSSVIYFLILSLGVLLVLEILGLEDVLTKLLAGAGIIGIIAGFAFKDIASNTFSGLLLNAQRPFKQNDWVEIDGTFGTIHDIGWITTSIKTISGQEVFIPNQLIYNSSFTNYSIFGKRRVIFQSGVSYGDDLELVRKVSIDEVKKIEAVLKNEEINFYFTGIGSSAYNFEVRFWIRFKHQKDYLNAMNEIIMRIKKRFEEENISLAYSVMTLDFGVKGGVNLFDKPINIKP